jgi:ribonuclease HI
MKSLKFEHKLAQLIAQGKKHVTWRIDDDKDLRVNDVIAIIDKVIPQSARSWKVIGTGKILTIIEKRLGDTHSTDYKGHEEYTSKAKMLEAFRHYYGPKVNEETAVKIIDFAFTPGYTQAPDDALNIVEVGVSEVKVYTDGGSRGNPGPSASGFVVTDMHDTLLAKDGLYLGITTNNQAEYHALKLGLEKALELNAKKVHVFMDSLLLVNQVKGLYKIKNAQLIPVNQAVKQIESRFEFVEYTHIPRELNKQADGMVNEVLDSTDL